MGNINQDNTCNYVRKTITFTLKLFAISGGDEKIVKTIFTSTYQFFKVKEVALFIMIFLCKSNFSKSDNIESTKCQSFNASRF